MFQYVKKSRTWDDAALTAPDDWSTKKRNVVSQKNNFLGVINQPEPGYFYCTEEKKDIVLISSDEFFTQGMRFMLEDVRNSILHIYHNAIDLNERVIKKCDVIIFSVTAAEDISKLYHLLIRLRLTHQNAYVIAVTDDDIKTSLSDVVKNHTGVKLVSYLEKPHVIKREILKRLKGVVEREKTTRFPANLTPRQADILSLAANGLSINDIARHAGISAITVYSLKAKALEKAGAINKPLEAILYSNLSEGFASHLM